MERRCKKKGMAEVNYKKIEEKANELLSEYNMPGKQGIDVVRLAQKLGFKVGQIELPDDQDGFIISNNNNDDLQMFSSSKIIGVNSNRTPEVKLFIIAHELGHYILREDQDAPIYAHREHTHGRSERENEIDFFAACLLMPRDSFIKEYQYAKYLFGGEEEKIEERLVKIFNVPTESVKRRMKETGVK